MRHGRAVLPFGKFRGVRIRLVPDDYISWLTTAPMIREPKWRWLYDSLISELKFRGLRYDLAETLDPVIEIQDVPVPMLENRRKFRAEAADAS